MVAVLNLKPITDVGGEIKSDFVVGVNLRILKDFQLLVLISVPIVVSMKELEIIVL